MVVLALDEAFSMVAVDDEVDDEDDVLLLLSVELLLSSSTRAIGLSTSRLMGTGAD